MTTGHSLGGAISMVMGLELKLHFSIIKVEVHNFGQPRVGEENLAQFMNSKLKNQIVRVVHNKDLVPHLPF